MKVWFVKAFMCLITFMHCLGGTAEDATATPSCPSKPPNNLRGSPGIPGKPGQQKTVFYQ